MPYFFLGGAKGHVPYCHVLTDYPGKKVMDGSICQLVYILCWIKPTPLASNMGKMSKH